LAKFYNFFLKYEDKEKKSVPYTRDNRMEN